jgi:hypothetical protein
MSRDHNGGFHCLKIRQQQQQQQLLGNRLTLYRSHLSAFVTVITCNCFTTLKDSYCYSFERE